MRRWPFVQMLMAAVLVTAACSLMPRAPTPAPSTPTPAPPAPTPTPSAPTPVTPTPIPDDAADNAYYGCGLDACYEVGQLTEEIRQTPLTDTAVCPALQGWQDTLEGIRERHGNCPAPRSRYLLAARTLLEGALEKTADSLFYLSEYCRSPSGGEEYSAACLDAVVEAQSYLRIAVDAFVAGRTEQPSDAEEATPGYAIYTHPVLRFSAEYPDGWDVEVRHPPTGETGYWGWVQFYPPDSQEEKLSGIAVTVLMLPAGGPLCPEELPTDEQYIEAVNEWAYWTNVEIVMEPSIMEVDGYKAVGLLGSGTGIDERYGVIGAAFIFVEDWWFEVQVVGPPDEQNEHRSIYEHLITTFDVLPAP
jgi:hypothetical protein